MPDAVLDTFEAEREQWEARRKVRHLGETKYRIKEREQAMSEDNMQEPIFPWFVFGRLRHVELETGLMLAGQLIVDVPSDTPSENDRAMVRDIIEHLAVMVSEGMMSNDAFLVAWGDKKRTANRRRADIEDDAIMAAWAKRSLTIALRVEARRESEGPPESLPIDSDLLRQIGMMKNP